MKEIKRIIYVEFSEAVDCGISASTIKSANLRKKANSRSSWNIIKDPSDKRKILISYPDLKPKYQNLVKAKFGNPHQYIKKQKRSLAEALISPLLTLSDADRQYYRDTLLYTDTQIIELTELCAWLRFLKTADNAWTKDHFKNRKELIETVMHILNEKSLEGLKKATNYRAFKRKLKDFSTGGPGSLISGRYGNQNGNKLTEVQRAALRSLYSDHRKYTMPKVHEKYLELSRLNDWPEITFETVRIYLNSPSIQFKTQQARNGKSIWRNTYEPILKRSNAKRPNDMWVIDGSPWELFYKEKDEKSRRWKLRKRVYGFVVIDAHSWKIIGYANGQTETENLVFKAIKNAAVNTGRLPRSIQSDNSAAIKSNSMLAWFKSIPSMHILAEAHLGRAKPIETLFKSFNLQILKEFHNFAGGGITAKKDDTHANEEWLLKHPETIPVLGDVLDQIDQAVEMWNERKMGDGLSPNEKFQHAESESIFKLQLEDQVSYFWKFKMAKKDTIRTYKYTNKGIKLQHNKQEYDYHVYDATGQIDKTFWAKYVNDMFNVKFDQDDMSMISLYQGGKFIAMAQQQRLGNMCVIDNTSDDALFLEKFREKRRQMLREVEQSRQDDIEYLEAEGVEMSVVDAEGFAKAPYTTNGKMKDDLNASKSAVKGKALSIYDISSEVRIIEDDE